MDLLIGTQNEGKLREYREILVGLPVRVLSLRDVGLHQVDVEEPADTFTGNAEYKATAYARAAGMFALADDSGLCVDVLDGRPGVYSARYAGTGATDADRRAKLLKELANVEQPKRTAHFECAIVVFNPQRHTPYISIGKLPGHIAFEESQGQYGFGYDAIFIPENYDVTLAELEPAIKNEISHRGRAARQMRPVIERLAKGLTE